jgi:hypothetical protein
LLRRRLRLQLILFDSKAALNGQQKRLLMPTHVDSSAGDRHKGDGSTLKLLLAAATGSVAYLLLRLIVPIPAPQSVLVPNRTPEGPNLIGFLFRIHSLLFESFWLQLIYFGWFVLLAVAKRTQPMARVYAFIAGYGFPYIIFHSLNLV